MFTTLKRCIKRQPKPDWFERNRVPPFESVCQCRACGKVDWHRMQAWLDVEMMRYCALLRVTPPPPHIRRTCTQCGAWWPQRLYCDKAEAR
jgi:hypothetical protein